MLQEASAWSMTWAERWYAARAAEGMPLVEAFLMSLSSLPAGTPGATSPGAEMFAGLSTAFAGTELPSGNVAASESVAEALCTARLVVQAPDSRARGTR